MIKVISDIREFLQVDLWKIKIGTLSKRKSFLYRQLRIWVITLSEFQKDKCAEKASALTYFSLLSVVPVVAMAYGIATVFGLEDFLREELQQYLAGQQEVLDYIMQFADKMLGTTSGGLISGISSVFLIYAVARLLNNIEVAFNDIWATKSSRSLKRKVTDYMSVIFLGPLILILSGTVTVFITSEMENITQQIGFLGFIKPGILFLVRLIPYTLIWFLLFLVYLVFPNAPVKIKPALIAGILAGTLFQVAQFAWIEGQVFLSKYNTIYGTFAALPLFLIYLQLSWIILLLGAEFAFALQNVTTWSYDNEKLYMNIKAKKKLTLLVLQRIIKYFEAHDGPMSFPELTESIVMPHRFIREITDDLEKSGLIIRVKNDEEEQYMPGMDIYKIDVYTVFSRLEEMGLNHLPQQDQNKGYKKISESVENINEIIKKAPYNKLVKDL